MWVPWLGDICDIQCFFFKKNKTYQWLRLVGDLHQPFTINFGVVKIATGYPLVIKHGATTCLGHLWICSLWIPMSFKGILPPILPSLLPTPRYKVWKKCLKRKQQTFYSQKMQSFTCNWNSFGRIIPLYPQISLYYHYFGLNPHVWWYLVGFITIPGHMFSPFWARHLSVLRTNHRRGRSVRPAVGGASRKKSSSGLWLQNHLPPAPGRISAEVSETIGHQRPTGQSLDWMQEWMGWWIEIQERHGWLNEGVGDWLAVWI